MITSGTYTARLLSKVPLTLDNESDDARDRTVINTSALCDGDGLKDHLPQNHVQKQVAC